MSRINLLLPVGLRRLLDYRNRLRALGISPGLSYSRRYRQALEISCIEIFPRESLTALKRVVDVGANVGEWSLGIACLTNAREIIAFEPNPPVFEQLLRNSIHEKRITCVQKAIGSNIGTIGFNVEASHRMSSILPLKGWAREFHGSGGRTEEITVPISTLDHELSSYDEISLLKLDVQGYESQVIEGGKDVLKRTKILMTEIVYNSYYENDSCALDLVNLITTASPLRLWGISAPGCSPSGRPLVADAIFVNSDYS
ncbi:methyltransferase, FkbM family [Singulisphaera sp. GP187]|uniref:FkbM family methyltransferase n=1 Tax=Singulisphaera sp. GP187 TaxID=1882752 RepID=UPI00092B484C|nr:FkbM family methyltransferase [Singulisphaera sp. GP187]SIO55288.1 methyltransferase, FkbM family [Singulisphaera sp. GP187]